MRNLRPLQRRSASLASLDSSMFTEDGTKTYMGGASFAHGKDGAGVKKGLFLTKE